jgi:HAD superfamily hydrolase (TIGR01509 family)
MAVLKALIFDCDGVLVDTERDGHRVAFNQAFKETQAGVEWSVELYGQLLKIAGGKERMCAYFDKEGWPEKVENKDEFIKKLHKLKTDKFMKIIEDGQLPLRSGIKRLIDEAIADNIALAVSSTSNERAVNLVVDKMLGRERKRKFCSILAGDVVAKKKPDPEIYNLTQKRLGIAPAECMVIEDSRNGLLAAKQAGMNCLITISCYTDNEDFTEADKVVTELGDPPDIKVDLNILKQIVAGKSNRLSNIV